MVKVWICCLLLVPVVIFLPNVQDLFSHHQPSLSKIDAKTDAAFWPWPGVFRKLTWQPTLRWASYLSILLVIGVMTLGQISDFLYFQF
ncbi:hypothetical protein [Neptunomonas qingdaonensis]|uniref:hypothetical protein n=1 Tax=Neptunomonas qingdaonensis TaxID=1045558 RepID=UPI001C43475D|nr:hypothetical protein [Neptunomonas qingdaonensis]